jgi:plastocyanin
VKRFAMAALGAWLLGAAAAAAEPAATGPAAKKPAEVQVKISGMRFDPPEPTARPGQEFVWRNEDLVPHTVTGRGFDSGVIAPGGSYRHRFAHAGRYDYRCALHPTMKATLTVAK